MLLYYSLQNVEEKILRYGTLGESYNISANNDITNKELIEKICEIYDVLVRTDYKNNEDRYKFILDRQGHDLRYAMNSDKIRKKLHWEPLQTLDSGLRMTINWYIHKPSYVSDCIKRIK